CVFASNVSCAPPVPPCEAGAVCNPNTGLCVPQPDPPFGTPCEADADLCTIDGCDGAGACIFLYPVFCPTPHPPCDRGAVCQPSTGDCIPQPDAPAGTPCNNDGNVCTIDRCDGNGACVLHEAPLGCVDHYLCYKVKATTPFSSPTVTLADQFETGPAAVK